MSTPKIDKLVCKIVGNNLLDCNLEQGITEIYIMRPITLRAYNNEIHITAHESDILDQSDLLLWSGQDQVTAADLQKKAFEKSHVTIDEILAIRHNPDISLKK